MITKVWKDFVLGVGAPIRSVEARFETRHGGRIVTRGAVETFGKRIETIGVTALGGVTVWTAGKVWGIREQIGFEKLIYLPRNPPGLGTGVNAFEWRDFILNTGRDGIRNIDGRFDIRRGGQIITRDVVEWNGDVIEAIDVSSLGAITVWTTGRVWCVR